MLSNEVLNEIEKIYGTKFKLTEAERRLLTSDRKLLSPIESQRAYVLRTYIAQAQCPACLKPTCVRAAQDGAENGIDWGELHPDEDHHCQRCGARLVMRMPLVGDIFFTLHQSEATPVITA